MNFFCEFYLSATSMVSTVNYGVRYKTMEQLKRPPQAVQVLPLYSFWVCVGPKFQFCFILYATGIMPPKFQIRYCVNIYRLPNIQFVLQTLKFLLIHELM